jgi:hypothetical protein
MKTCPVCRVPNNDSDETCNRCFSDLTDVKVDWRTPTATFDYYWGWLVWPILVNLYSVVFNVNVIFLGNGDWSSYAGVVIPGLILFGFAKMYYFGDKNLSKVIGWNENAQTLVVIMAIMTAVQYYLDGGNSGHVAYTVLQFIKLWLLYYCLQKVDKILIGRKNLYGALNYDSIEPESE